MPPNQNLGNQGERLAARWLTKNKGFKILEVGWRQGSFTQLDILARDTSTTPETLVAVEVKTRVSDRFGRGITAVIHKKLFHIKRSLAYFIKTHPTLPKKLRIDVVDVLIRGEMADVRYYRNIL